MFKPEMTELTGLEKGNAISTLTPNVGHTRALLHGSLLRSEEINSNP